MGGRVPVQPMCRAGTSQPALSASLNTITDVIIFHTVKLTEIQFSSLSHLDARDDVRGDPAVVGIGPPCRLAHGQGTFGAASSSSSVLGGGVAIRHAHVRFGLH